MERINTNTQVPNNSKINRRGGAQGLAGPHFPVKKGDEADGSAAASQSQPLDRAEEANPRQEAVRNVAQQMAGSELGSFALSMMGGVLDQVIERLDGLRSFLGGFTGEEGKTDEEIAAGQETVDSAVGDIDQLFAGAGFQGESLFSSATSFEFNFSYSYSEQISELPNAEELESLSQGEMLRVSAFELSLSVSFSTFSSATLGSEEQGHLEEVKSGGEADLATDPQKAAEITDVATEQTKSVAESLRELVAQLTGMGEGANPFSALFGSPDEGGGFFGGTMDATQFSFDFAYEMSTLSQGDLLLRADEAVSSMANQSPEGVLEMLKES